MGGVQSNEYNDWAKAQVQAGKYKTVCDALAAALAAATDSATKLKIVQAEKFAGCRNVGKAR
jgi:Arc/MetJ-type ribon-helix-helix transcriptional regulator